LTCAVCLFMFMAIQVSVVSWQFILHCCFK
jgi:hypothetical protein